MLRVILSHATYILINFEKYFQVLAINFSDIFTVNGKTSA